MKKEELLIVIHNTQQKFSELINNPNNIKGGTQSVKVVEAILEKAKLSVEGTEDSPIFRRTFDSIGVQVPQILSNLGSDNQVENEANNILGSLVKLALPESVTALRKTNEKMRERLVVLEIEIKNARSSTQQNLQEGIEQRIQHSEEYKLIEKTHNDQLQFEAPVTTWSKASVKYSKQGWLFMVLVVILTIITSYFLYKILMTTPLETWDMFSREEKGAAIRWSIVLLALVGFIAYAIRAATRAMFSAFHLARDSGERALLAQFYLGLINNGALDPSDRAIVMQSLFSRTDTGLLKDDGSPTMAGDLVAKINSAKKL